MSHSILLPPTILSLPPHPFFPLFFNSLLSFPLLPFLSDLLCSAFVSSPFLSSPLQFFFLLSSLLSSSYLFSSLQFSFLLLFSSLYSSTFLFSSHLPILLPPPHAPRQTPRASLSARMDSSVPRSLVFFLRPELSLDFFPLPRHGLLLCEGGKERGRKSG